MRDPDSRQDLLTLTFLVTVAVLWACALIWLAATAFAADVRLDPDPKLTPGIVEVTDARIVCTPGYARRARHVTVAVRRQVWKRYGYDRPPPGDWELDHLIPLELGGGNGADNLWPQPAEPTPGYHEKDWVEQALHRLVCAGLLPLSAAQARVRDWVAVWIILQPHPVGKPLGIGGVSGG